MSTHVPASFQMYDYRGMPERPQIGLLSAVIPSPAADAAHDAAHETAARFQHGAYSVSCPKCHVPAGVFCLARRNVHAARRDLYRQNPETTGLVPLLVGRAR